MLLISRIAEDLKQAMKARDEARVSVLRMVAAAFKNKQIDLMHELTDADAVGVLRTLVKQYRDSLEDFRRGGRADLVEKTEGEIAVIERYLPAGPSEADLDAAVQAVIAESGSVTEKDFGRVMSAAMKRLGSGADGQVVSAKVRAHLEKR